MKKIAVNGIEYDTTNFNKWPDALKKMMRFLRAGESIQSAEKYSGEKFLPEWRELVIEFIFNDINMRHRGTADRESTIERLNKMLDRIK